MSQPNVLPPLVESGISDFVQAAQAAFGADLISAVLYGSAAEGRLRATSDVNMLLVLSRFEKNAADQLREPLRMAHATVGMNVMFILQDELTPAMDAFAVKFADIASRHQVRFGSDPFLNLDTSRDALARRLNQVLLNLQLRLRERYVLTSLREEQLALVVADAAGPLRSSAASLLQLEGRHAPAPKEALEQVVADMNDATLTETLHAVSAAREARQLPPGKAAPTMMKLIELTQRLRERLAMLS